MKRQWLKRMRSWSPLAAWTSCIRSGKDGEIRFSLFA